MESYDYSIRKTHTVKMKMYGPIKIETAPKWVHKIIQEYLPKFNQLKGKKNRTTQQTKLSEEIVELLKQRKQQLGLSTQSMQKTFEYIRRLLEVNGHQLLADFSSEGMESQQIGEIEQQQQTEIEQLKQQLESYQKSTQHRIEQLEEKLKQLEAKLQQQETKIVRPSPRTQTRDWESVDKDELLGLGEHEKPANGVGSAEERIRRSVEAVIKWNDQFSTEAGKEKKIVPNTQLIRAISGSNAQRIRQWLNAHNHYILDHLSKHGLTKNGKPDNYHNSRHQPEPHRNPEILIKLIA